MAKSVFLITGVLLGLLLLTASHQRARERAFPLTLFAQAKVDDYLGTEACVPCHRSYVVSFRQSAHAPYMEGAHLSPDRRGCEACHGPGAIHLREVLEPKGVIRYSKMTPEEVSRACLRCHGATMRPSQWHRTAHARAGLSCISCHQIHPHREKQGAPSTGDMANPVKPLRMMLAASKPSHPLLKEEEAALCTRCHAPQAAEFRLNFHHPLPEGRMLCTDCHEVHPDRESVRRARLIREQCVHCHTDKMGPFAFEHDPAAGWMGDSCVECHRPHGSPNPRMLKLFSRGLCAQCHTDKGVQHYPARNCWESGCHVAHHGSNTNPLFLSY
jgi:predicted CXXCH cytochrome family protein